MLRKYDAICGITQEELEHYFAKPIIGLAKAYHCDVPEIPKQRSKGRFHSTLSSAS